MPVVAIVGQMKAVDMVVAGEANVGRRQDRLLHSGALGRMMYSTPDGMHLP